MKIKTTSPKRVICVGLGPIGRETCKLILKNPLLRLVGLVDKDPRKIGKDLGFGTRIEDSVQDCARRVRPDIAFLTTASRFGMVMEDIQNLVRMGVDVVSSCEELSFPWLVAGKAADRLDGFVRKNKRRVLGTGVNPGFVMDALALMLANVCQKVHSIKVRRVVDVAKRRLPLQRKMSVGLSRRAFQQKLLEGTTGHVGLKESLALIGAGMGWKLRLEEKIRPLYAKRPMKTRHFSIRSGQVIGIEQIAKGTENGKVKAILELTMRLGEKEPADEVWIGGIPPVRMKISPGVQGDLATASCLINAALKLEQAPHGLLTVNDLSVARKTRAHA